MHKQGQDLALKVVYSLKVFGDESCLAVAQKFDQIQQIENKFS